MAFLSSGQGWPYALVPFIPLAVVLDAADANPTIVFFVSALGVIPTAALMGRATEELAAQSGPGIGGLLNVTFGNAPELIIALFALGKGLQEVVKASIVGSVISNILLVLGAAMFFGGWKRDKQTFNRYRETDEEEDARGWSVRQSVLVLAVAGAGVALMSELLVGSIEHAAKSVGLSQFFIGVVVVAIVGNAAEHWVAVLVALKDKM